MYDILLLFMWILYIIVISLLLSFISNSCKIISCSKNVTCSKQLLLTTIDALVHFRGPLNYLGFVNIRNPILLLTDIV